MRACNTTLRTAMDDASRMLQLSASQFEACLERGGSSEHIESRRQSVRTIFKETLHLKGANHRLNLHLKWKDCQPDVCALLVLKHMCTHIFTGETCP